MLNKRQELFLEEMEINVETLYERFRPLDKNRKATIKALVRRGYVKIWGISKTDFRNIIKRYAEAGRSKGQFWDDFNAGVTGLKNSWLKEGMWWDIWHIEVVMKIKERKEEKKKPRIEVMPKKDRKKLKKKDLLIKIAEQEEEIRTLVQLVKRQGNQLRGPG